MLGLPHILLICHSFLKKCHTFKIIFATHFQSFRLRGCETWAPKSIIWDPDHTLFWKVLVGISGTAGAYYYLIIIDHSIGLPLVLPQLKDNRFLLERFFFYFGLVSMEYPFNFSVTIQGGLSIRNGQNRSNFTLSQKKVRAIIGLVPTSQLPWWCYIENERTIWEQNGLIETPTLREIIAKWLREKA